MSTKLMMLLVAAAVCIAVVSAQPTQPTVPAAEERGVAFTNEQTCQVYTSQMIALNTDQTWKKANDQCDAKTLIIIRECQAHVNLLTQEHKEMIIAYWQNLGVDIAVIRKNLENVPSVQRCQSECAASTAELNRNFTAQNKLLTDNHAAAIDLTRTNADTRCDGRVNDTKREQGAVASNVLTELKRHFFNVTTSGPRSAVSTAALMVFTAWVQLTYPDKRTYVSALCLSLVNFVIVHKIVTEENALFDILEKGDYTKFGNMWWCPGVTSFEWVLDFYLGIISCVIIFVFLKGDGTVDKTHSVAVEAHSVAVDTNKKVDKFLGHLSAKDQIEELNAEIRILKQANADLQTCFDSYVDTVNDRVAPAQLPKRVGKRAYLPAS